MSNLNNPMAYKVDCSELEIFEMDGAQVTSDSTGLILLVRPDTHGEVKKINKKSFTEVVTVKSAAKKEEDPELKAHIYMYERSEELLKERVRAHVEGWRWKENSHPEMKSLKFSQKQLNEFLDSEPFGEWIKSQVISYTVNSKNFLQKPVKD